MRIGHGYDVHKLVYDRDLILGGVLIENEKGLLGNSDADVLVHAIMDSLLGAAGLADIGTFFPDDTPEFKNADSLVLLNEVCKKVKALGYRILNIDSTIIAQAPKLSKYILKMRQNISKVCFVSVDKVNVKATTEEGLGFTGHKEGICAHAVCLLD